MTRLFLNCRTFWPVAKGMLFKVHCAVFHPRVRIGRRLRCEVWPRVQGPGRIMIGDKVCFVDNYGIQSCLKTWSPDALVRIGDMSVLGGTKISCSKQIDIGPRTLLGLATIMDSAMVPPTLTSAVAEGVSLCGHSIRLGEGVWIGTHAFVGPGVDVGRGSVVGAGSVVRDAKVPDGVTMMGNPARIVQVWS